MANHADPEIPPDLIDSTQAAAPSDVVIASIPEVPTTMLDIHAPHNTVHTWKDFFIHLATISTGLLIAIGLEQSVEYLHHRHQAQQMMEKLRAESIENHDILLLDIETTDRVIAAVDANLLALAATSEGQEKSPFVATPLPTWIGYVPGDTTWLIMRDSALLSIVPELLAENYFKIEVTMAALDRWKWVAEAARTQLEATLKVYSHARVLSPQEREGLQRAYSEYGVALSRYGRTAKQLDIVDSMALANEVINPEAGRRHGIGAPD